MRVELLQRYARKFFPTTKYLDYALHVERYTLTKAANLVFFNVGLGNIIIYAFA